MDVIVTSEAARASDVLAASFLEDTMQNRLKSLFSLNQPTPYAVALSLGYLALGPASPVATCGSGAAEDDLEDTCKIAPNYLCCKTGGCIENACDPEDWCPC